ncbi:MAG: hypothetical protein K6E35_00330 [Bacteroidales bacterium]|nr:hypothetical protein [Bacteroidales bacterium]
MRPFLPLFIPVIAFALAACSASDSVPISYSEENTASSYVVPDLPSFSELTALETLPDPLAFLDGSGRALRLRDWERRRAEILAQLQYYEVGTKPVTPKECVSARMENDTTLVVDVTVNGQTLTMHSVLKRPEGPGPFPVIIGCGFGGPGSLPRPIFEERGIAMVSFPFWEVMNHTQVRGSEPINKLYPELTEIGAYSAWPWGVSRLIDALEQLGDESRLDLGHIAISGCSFAGKMALWSGAMDERIALTIAQEPGGGGAAAWRVSETLGEVETVGRTNYAWFKESMRDFSEENVSRLPMDHHELCALVAPRALLVFGNPDYPWLADRAGYVSCVAARRVWEQYGIADRMGFSFQDKHMHCMLPQEEWPELEAFVDRFLLGKAVSTEVTTAPMFEDTDLGRWINW